MFKVLEGATAPTRATRYSAYVDLYAKEDIVIGAGCTLIVNLGVKIDIENFWDSYSKTNLFDKSEHQLQKFKEHFLKRHYLELHPRSSLRAKGLIVGVRIIDLDYPDEIGLIVHNPIISSNTSTFSVIAETVRVTPNLNGVGNGVEGRFVINKGDKVAQITLKEHKGWLMCIESDTERTGGFGSSGK